MSTFSERATRYFEVRGIDPRTAFDCGVREQGGAIVWPTVDADGNPSPRRRRLGDGPGPKCRGAAGRTLGVWWPRGRPQNATGPTGVGDVLVCEGESDALAAVTVLGGLAVSVASIPGASFPLRVLVHELWKAGARVAALAFDGDMAGANAADRLAAGLVQQGIGARILAVPHGEDLASVLAVAERPRAWLAHALVAARPVGVVEAALVAENRWLRARELERLAAADRMAA